MHVSSLLSIAVHEEVVSKFVYHVSLHVKRTFEDNYKATIYRQSILIYP